MSSYLVSPILGQLSYFSHSALVVKGPTWFSEVLNNARWKTFISLAKLSRTILTWQSSQGMSPSRKWSQFGKSEKGGDDIFEDIITGWSRLPSENSPDEQTQSWVSGRKLWANCWGCRIIITWRSKQMDVSIKKAETSLSVSRTIMRKLRGGT